VPFSENPHTERQREVERGRERVKGCDLKVREENRGRERER
jgi:hypothetical protein